MLPMQPLFDSRYIIHQKFLDFNNFFEPFGRGSWTITCLELNCFLLLNLGLLRKETFDSGFDLLGFGEV